MKKALSLVLVLVMVLSLAACGSDSKKTTKNDPIIETTEPIETTAPQLSAVEQWLEDNRAELLSTVEQNFAGSSGMTCTSDAKVEGNGIIINININELDNLGQAEKDMLQQTYDSMLPSFGFMLTGSREELPELEFITMNVCEVDGDLIASIHVDDEALAAAPTGESSFAKIQAYIDSYGAELVESMEYSFAESSGMTCTSDIWALGNGIEIALVINELDNLTDDEKAQLQAGYDAMAIELSPVIVEMQAEIPELDYMTLYICEADGDLAAYMIVDAVGGPNENVYKYVEANQEELVTSMEQSFAGSSGMTCETSVEVIGNGIVITLYINELDNLTDEEKLTTPTTYDAMGSTWDTLIQSLRTEIPELEFFTLNVCEADGDMIAAIVMK